MEEPRRAVVRRSSPRRERSLWGLRELLGTAPSLVLVVLLLLDQVDVVEPFDAWPLGGWAHGLDGFLLLAIFLVLASVFFITWRLGAVESRPAGCVPLSTRWPRPANATGRSSTTTCTPSSARPRGAALFGEVNAVTEQVSGYTCDELRGTELTGLVDPEQRAWVLGMFSGVLKGEPLQADISIIRKDGTARELSVTGLPIVVHDDVVGAYGIAEDVAERHRLERELDAARVVAEEANAAKSVFMANMSHELRTPLTSVLGADFQMLMDVDLDTESARLARTVDRSGKRLLRLVNDLLDFAKIEAGRADLERVPLDVRALVDEVATAAVPAADAKGLRLGYDVDEAVPAELLGDPSRIAQVLTNLLDNAVKFTASGEVAVGVEVVAVDGDTVELLVCVRDTGIGLGAEQESCLFESFRQADPSMTREHGGTGLGLAICHQLVELMGGSIWVESSPGDGSTFSVVLPLGRDVG